MFVYKNNVRQYLISIICIINRYQSSDSILLLFDEMLVYLLFGLLYMKRLK